MSTARSKSLIAVVFLLVVLALVSATSLTINQLAGGQLASASFRSGRFGGGAPGSGTPAPGGNSQGSSSAGSNFQGGSGGNFQGRGGGFFSMAGIFRALGLNFQIMNYANIGVAAIGILLLLISAVGVWMRKRWALYLAIAVAPVFLLGAVPGFFFGGGRFTPLRTGLNLLNSACAIAVLFLSFLPASRSSVS